MANLNNYIDFDVALDKSDPDNPVIRVTDTGTYPGNIALYLEGIVSITQPDGISVDGSFTDPDIYSSGGSLISSEKELRLSEDDTLQNGIYSITYTINVTGYDTTQRTKTFTLDYTTPNVIITNLLDVFTPDIQVVDATVYAQSGFTTTTISRAWSADIKYVGSTIQTVTGTLILFDISYGDEYYDAFYAVTLETTVTYTMVNFYDWVSVIDMVEAETQMDAYTPPTLAALQVSLNTLRTQILNGTYCGGCGCGCDNPDYAPWEQASDLLQSIIANGQQGNTTGLNEQVDQLLKIFNCSGVLTRTHTNDPITPYDWGTTQIISLPAPIQFTVGSGGQYAPADGDSEYNNPTLAGNNRYSIFSKGMADILQENVDYTYLSGGGFELIGGLLFTGADRFTLTFYGT